MANVSLKREAAVVIVKEIGSWLKCIQIMQESIKMKKLRAS